MKILLFAQYMTVNYKEKMNNSMKDNANTIDKFSRKASHGKYRVLGYDQYNYSDYFIDEFDDFEQAVELLRKELLKLTEPQHHFQMNILFILIKMRLCIKERLMVALKS
ncbi:MAG: hypothetical protein ACJAXS_001916 [Colwellia sp.]|jgi:hypothetical protein